MNPRIDRSRLLRQVEDLARIGGKEGGCSRLALSDEDKQARDRVVGWMREAAMEVQIDGIGNIIALRRGTADLPPIMTGSHIDTVTNGGRLDGSYGVLAGLEVVRTLDDHGIETGHPIAVTVFTNEEGVRYTPDMMGSLVYAGGLSLDEALGASGRDGTTVGGELQRIGYAGETPCGSLRPGSFVELHIEQGPVLEQPIDFWRVEKLEMNKQLLLRAEMLSPGLSWLQIILEPQGSQSTRLILKAHFIPKPFWGPLYWSVMARFHNYIFTGMLSSFQKAALQEKNGPRPRKPSHEVSTLPT